MISKDEFRLTGGVFFALFFHACKEQKEQKSFVIKDANKGPIPTVMDELLFVMTGKREKREVKSQQTFKDNVNKYRFCRANSCAHVKIGKNDPITSGFDSLVRKNYALVLERMRTVVEGYLHATPEMDILLVKAVIELISLDKQMANVELFVDGENPLTVNQILELKTVDLAAFLLGVWHYCVTAVDNEPGKDTIDTICPSNKGNKRPYVGDLGGSIATDIKLYDIQIAPSEKSISDKEPERVEAEIVDTVVVGENDKKEQAQEDNSKPAPQMVFNFNVTGNNNSFYNHVDTVNNIYGGKKDGQ